MNLTSFGCQPDIELNASDSKPLYKHCILYFHQTVGFQKITWSGFNTRISKGYRWFRRRWLSSKWHFGNDIFIRNLEKDTQIRIANFASPVKPIFPDWTSYIVISPILSLHGDTLRVCDLMRVWQVQIDYQHDQVKLTAKRITRS